MVTRTKNPGITKKTDAGCGCSKPAACSNCGGTECFERPRYFSGQLLTDRDLDAAQRYVINKNKLHNRYLIGTGVACGLAVRCDRCDDGTVVVQPGYAIDCCGNDIVVCDPAKFDVYEALNGCKPKADECGQINVDTRCGDLPTEYYLVLYYNEEPSRPVTALMRNDGCNSVRCEPSRTKETFRLALVEKEEYQRRTEPNMWANIRSCVTVVAAEIRKYWAQIEALGKQTTFNYVQAYQIFCRMRDSVLKIYGADRNTRCTLALELKALEDKLPSSGQDPKAEAKFGRAYILLLAYMFQYLLDCICDALLVPCSSCDGDEGVLLACLTVEECRVRKVCNTVRTQLITGPAMRYWFQPVYSVIGRLLEKLCCDFDIIELFSGFYRPKYEEPPANPTTPVHAARPMAANYTKETANQAEAEAMASAGDVKDGDTKGTAWNDVNATYTTENDEPKISGFDPGIPATRGANIFSMVSDYTDVSIDSLDTPSLLSLFSSNTIGLLDLYKMPVADAGRVLGERKITYSVKHAASDAEAYSLGNIGKMSWAIPENSHVELLADPSGVVSHVRVVKEAGK